MTETTVQDQDTELIAKAQAAFQIFLDCAPSQDFDRTPEAAEEIVNYVVDNGLDQTIAGNYLQAHRAIKAEKARAIAAEAADVEKETQRMRRLRDYARPSSVDKAAIIEEFRARQTKPQPRELPQTNYTQSQMDAMSGDEFRYKVLGITRPDDQFVDAATVKDTEDARTRTNRRILQSTNKNKSQLSPMSRALRQQALTELEARKGRR